MNSSPQLDPTSPHAPPTHDSARTALVLGGGSIGNAWLIGVVAGLAEAGMDVTTADLVVGTSAGSTAAAQITSARPGALLADTVRAAPSSPPSRTDSVARPASRAPVIDHQERTARIIAAAVDAADMRRRLGAAALALEAPPDWSARWRSIVASRLPNDQWPPRRLLITAVDARTGEPVVLDADSGLDLVDAVAASCSSGYPYRIGDDWYLDGGYRSNADNADLAAGYEHVLVLSPFGGRSRTPAQWGLRLADQVAHLRAHGSRVETVVPDSASLAAFGDDMMDVSRRAPAARAGNAQGLALAPALRAIWG